MATKLKNNSAAKFISWMMIIGLSLLLLVLSAFQSYLFGSFEKSEGFKNAYYQFQYSLIVAKLNHPSLNEVKQLPVTSSDINEFRYRYGDLPKQLANVRSQYENAIAKAEDAKDKKVAAYYKKERDQKIKAVELNFKSDSHVIKQVRSERVAYMKKYYSGTMTYEQENFNQLASVFYYHFVNKKTGNVVTNVPSAEQKSKNKQIPKRFEKTLHSLSTGRSINSNNKIVDRVLYLSASDYSGRIYIEKNTSLDKLGPEADYQGFVSTKIISFIVLALSVALIAGGVYLGWKKSIFYLVGFEKIKKVYTRIPIESRLFIFIVELLIFVDVLTRVQMNGYVSGYYLPDSRSGLMIFVLGILCAVTTLLYQAQWLIDLLRDPVKRTECWKQSIFMQTGVILSNLFVAPFLGLKMLVAFALIFFLGMSAPLFTVSGSFALAFVFLMFTALPLLWMTLKRVTSLSQIILHAESIAAGQDQPDLLEHGRGALNRLSQSLNTLKHGVKTSRNAQLKSERLKTELITNVSHDLRTPLTSIITYNDLLKKSDVTEAERQDYLSIIDRKAKRLKRLIDDLFEASKMASGAIELNKTKVNLNELLKQSLAEYDETIHQAQLDFRIKSPDTAINVFGDGQKLWRVFDNLIGNILKYSMEGTRVYIALDVENGEAIVTFKNITKYELGANVDELFERFKRGDASRHTEGSGLGLAIAKSIIDLHDGMFLIDLDGDLFKVTIKLPVL
ncbi:HAMP domain-containing sensor histidine kinase [Sporolactobacillus laevolacticus]|uniref:HAMP domain-containing sensor histidine kinase n=1 Tax=Sporolactobacillus laevolacticus TaxID=33018 RepID=UPI0025B397D0|nr:HAMP domain-containing sensor histidine kinase [Sporolactobacillus laevolacticus]MDN3954050.1 HAMP domain-containing sensor histidine kinase [Sporolactobacillus laevolacticus]